MSIHAPSVNETIAALATEFTGHFPEQIQQPRIVGREAEFPVVDAHGEAADVRRLWERLMQPGDLTPKFEGQDSQLLVELAGADYSYALEVGLGTVEINTRPSGNLYEIESIMTRAVGRLVRAALDYGWRILGYGIQPVSPPTESLMSPKQRYQSLYRAMGQSWLWYTVTASDQVQVDVARSEIVPMLNFGNMMAPVLIALCANSPVFGGKLSPYCSGREGRMADIHANEYRHGMPARPYSSIADYIETCAQSTFLIRRGDGEIVPSSITFLEYLQEQGPDFEAFRFHEHYIWNSARLRVAYGTLELRPACQQPWGEQMAAAALGLGLIEARAEIADYVASTLGAEYWAVMRAYHQQAIQRGLAASQPAPDFLETIVEFARAGLQRRQQGEEVLLEPVRRRLSRRENPAQRVRRIYRSDGLEGLLPHTAIRPHATRPAAT